MAATQAQTWSSTRFVHVTINEGDVQRLSSIQSGELDIAAEPLDDLASDSVGVLMRLWG